MENLQVNNTQVCKHILPRPLSCSPSLEEQAYHSSLSAEPPRCLTLHLLCKDGISNTNTREVLVLSQNEGRRRVRPRAGCAQIVTVASWWTLYQC